MKKIFKIFIKTPELIAMGIFIVAAALFLFNYAIHKADLNVAEDQTIELNGSLGNEEAVNSQENRFGTSIEEEETNNRENAVTEVAENQPVTEIGETENPEETTNEERTGNEKPDNDSLVQSESEEHDFQTEEVIQDYSSQGSITIETNEDGTTTVLCETKETDEGTYTIYQLFMTDEAGGCSYAIQMPNGKFIVIDSGYKLDGQWIQDFLQLRGGEVDSWYITHPHFDHVGGLLQILQNNSPELYIDKIYYAPFTAEFYTEEQPDKDLDMINNASLFLEFETQRSRNDIQFIPVERGDIITTGGITITCMSSFDEDLYDVNGNSLALHMDIKGITMLITGDITETTIDIMKEYWGEDNSLWQVDFLQMPHHGYSAGIATDSLYRITMPAAAFIDCSTNEYEDNAANLHHHLDWLVALEIPVIKRFEGTNKIVID